MSLDLWLDGTTSWREVQSRVHGVLTGAGRGLTWAPSRPPKVGAERVTLAHTTRWCWFQEAARGAATIETVQDRYRGLFSAAWRPTSPRVGSGASSTAWARKSALGSRDSSMG